MHGHRILLIVVLAAATGLPDIADAQFSPGGFVGAVTRPFRQMLGHLGHFPRGHRSHMTEKSRSSASQRPQLGDVGPVAWSSAYEDILGYTFWPGDYAGQIRARGFDVIAAAITGATRGREPARVATTGSAAASDRAACGQGADAKIAWPVSQIEQTAHLNDAQRAALDRLGTAVADSVKTIKAGCRDASSQPPLDRITADIQELWAVRDAGIYVRAPLKDFYDSLTDAQKAGFDWKEPQDNSRSATKAADSGKARQYQACAAPSLESSERMLKQIEEKVRPSKAQTAGMEALRKTATEMAKMLTASCGQPIPADPVARLDAANNQLSSMSYAATSLEIALEGFYAQLDAEQKTGFNSLGR